MKTSDKIANEMPILTA